MKYINIKTSKEILKMPIIGLGTWRAQPDEIEKALWTALEAGYRHIDTAFNYNTEETIGKVLKQWFEKGGKREELFITTKLPNCGNRASDVSRFLNLSLEKLQLNYVDLYLIHMPFSFHLNETNLTPLQNEDASFSLDYESDLLSTWQAMENEVEKGTTKSIGLSNFNQEQIQRIYTNAKIKPAVLQIELHAYLQQKQLREICGNYQIAVTAYAPLGSPGANQHFNSKYNYSIQDFPDILGHPLIAEMAQKYQKTSGQILLKHLIQQDIIVIPKSSNPKRLQTNLEIFDFELEPDDLEKLNGLDRGENGRIFDFLFFKGVEKHPEYPFKQRLDGW